MVNKHIVFRDIIVTWAIIYLAGVMGSGIAYIQEGKLTLFEVFVLIPNVMAIVGMLGGIFTFYIIIPILNKLRGK